MEEFEKSQEEGISSERITEEIGKNNRQRAALNDARTVLYKKRDAGELSVTESRIQDSIISETLAFRDREALKLLEKSDESLQAVISEIEETIDLYQGTDWEEEEGIPVSLDAIIYSTFGYELSELAQISPKVAEKIDELRLKYPELSGEDG